MGEADSPLLLTRPDALPDTIDQHLTRENNFIFVVVVFGGTAAVSDAVAAKALQDVHAS